MCGCDMHVCVALLRLFPVPKGRTRGAQANASGSAAIEEELLTQGVMVDTPPDEAPQETTSPVISSPPDPATLVHVVSELMDEEHHSATPLEKNDVTPLDIHVTPLEENDVALLDIHVTPLEENDTTPLEETTTTPFAYIGNFLVSATSNPAEEPTEIVANTVGESRHYRMQASIAGG